MKKKVVGVVGGALGKVRDSGLFGKYFSAPVVLAVSFGTDHVKIGHGRNFQGKFLIEGIALENIEKKSEAEIAQIIVDYCSSQRMKPAQALCPISPKQFIFKNVDIPSTEREEISKIIDLQAGRFTPYMREEIVIDFLCLDAMTQHYTSVLLFIVNRKISDRYTGIFSQARINLDRIVAVSECMAMTYGKASSEVPCTGAVGGLNISEESSALTVLDGNQIVFVRNIPVGADMIRKNPAQARPEFISELNNSMAAYHDQGVGKPIGVVLMTGLVEGLETLGDELKNATATQVELFDLSIFDYKKYFDMSEPAKEVLRKKKEFSFFEIFSTLAFSGQAKINLLCPEIKLKQRVREGARQAITLGALIMAVLLLLCLIMGSKIYFRKMINQKLDRSNKAFSMEARRLERISTKNRIVAKLLGQRGKELQVLNVINDFISDDLYLSQINYDNQGKVNVSGTAASMSRVFSFVTQLVESNHFKSVVTKETKSRKEGKQDVADFSIECTLPQMV